MAVFDKKEVLEFHRGGKVAVKLPKPLKTKDDLCLAYTPGVAHAVKEIAANPDSVYDVTAKSNLVAVVSDGPAILGLGDLGEAASIPVMEGKAVLFKAFGDVDAWPVPLNCCRMGGANEGKTDPKRVIEFVKAIAPQYGGVNLEDIASPACFEIEDTLDRELDIPVFHDDQWGTAVISLSGVMNYAELAGKKMSTAEYRDLYQLIMLAYCEESVQPGQYKGEADLKITYKYRNKEKVDVIEYRIPGKVNLIDGQVDGFASVE